MFNKRGLSDIVTNVLIILLVLVAVTIIWFFLRPTIEGGAGQLGGAGDCLTVQLEPVSCSFVSSSGGTSLYDVEVKRNPGSATVSDLKLVFTTASGNQVIDASTAGFTSIDELGSWTDSISVTGTATGFSVAAVIDADGTPRTCQTSQTITCS